MPHNNGNFLHHSPCLKIVYAVFKNECTVGIFLDLSKAFDILNHGISCTNSKIMVFRCIMIDWFKSYSNNLKQVVPYQMPNSDHKTIKCGACPSDIFVVHYYSFVCERYCNIITSTYLVCTWHTFVFLASKVDTINNELQEICNWLEANKLFVNSRRFITWYLELKFIPKNLVN